MIEDTKFPSVIESVEDMQSSILPVYTFNAPAPSQPTQHIDYLDQFKQDFHANTVTLFLGSYHQN